MVRSENIFRVETTGFAVDWLWGVGKKWGVKNDSKIFYTSTWKNGLKSYKMVNSVGEQVWGKSGETSLVWGILVWGSLQTSK